MPPRRTARPPKQIVCVLTINYRVPIENAQIESILDHLRELGAATITAVTIEEGEV